MINVNDIVAIDGVVVGVVGGTYGVLPLLKKKGVNTDKVLSTTENVITATQPIVKVAESIPTLKPAATLVDFMEQKAIAAVKAAEQLGHAGSLQTNEEKFQSAQNTVYAALKEINITPTDNQKKLIDDFIQEGVNELGHATPTEAEKNAEIAKAKQDLATVQAENTQLKQKLTTIQSTAGTSTVQK